MSSEIQINPAVHSINTQPSCVDVTFYSPKNNPFFSISAADDRGVFYGLEYADTRPFLVEILHSNAGAVRGNHIHQHCTELFTVLSGDLDMYLLCSCAEKHLYKKRLTAGMTAAIHPGIAHAIHSITQTECTAVFYDNDPRQDRERVELIQAGS